jgi:hypothetical protein
MFKRYTKAKPQKALQLIDSCEKLTVWRYLKILETGDLRLLISSGNTDDETLQKTFSKILEEYQNLEGESNTNESFDKILYLEELKMKVQTVNTLICSLEMAVVHQIIDKQILDGYLYELKKWGFPINLDNAIIDELKAIQTELEAYISTIKILHAEIYPENNDDQTAETKNKVLLFYDMLLSYQRILEIDKINPKKTSMLELVAIKKQVKNKIEYQKKLNDKK